MKLYVTLRQINGYRPCMEGWLRLVKPLGGGYMDRQDEKFDVLNVLKSNGLPDFLWLFQKIKVPHSLSIAIAFNIAEKSFSFFYKEYPQHKEFKQLKAAIKYYINQPIRMYKDNVQKYLEAIEKLPLAEYEKTRHLHSYAITNVAKMILGWDSWSENETAYRLCCISEVLLGLNGYTKTKNVFKKHLA